jgi:ATP-dependent protease ClpP protease subunit
LWYFVSVIGHIYIYGEVGKQVTLDTVLQSITPKASSYVVHIISNGGDVFEGYAIYNAIKNTGKDITVHIEGVCASIATLIAAAGSKIIMNTKSQFMIHNPRIASMGGDSKDLRNVAAQLDKIKSQLIDSWVGRTSLSVEQLSNMYDHETWLTPEQAKEMGFVDDVQEILKAAASADIKKHYHMEHNTILAAIQNLGNRINGLFAPKNVTDTLADGTVVSVPEEGDWTGKPITLEDGTPLPDGEYTLDGGRMITVAGGTIATVKDPEAKTEETPEDMDLKEKLAAAEARATALEARNKELESAIEASTKTAQTAEAKAKSFENKLNTEVKNLSVELEKLKNTTAGDTTPPAKAIKQSNGLPVAQDGFQRFIQEKVINPRNTD